MSLVNDMFSKWRKAQHRRCDLVHCQVTTYTTIQELSKERHRAAEGTLAYVSERGGELYVRTHEGWRKIQVCTVFSFCVQRLLPNTEVLIYFIIEFTKDFLTLLSSVIRNDW